MILHIYCTSCAMYNALTDRSRVPRLLLGWSGGARVHHEVIHVSLIFVFLATFKNIICIV